MMGHQVIDSFSPPYLGPLGALVDGARADLAGRLGVDLVAVGVEGVYAVIWPDSSAGCPQPGRAYMQALVEGALIVLRVADERYSYHSAEGRPAFLCR
jgi:hypothetical protein